MDSKIYLVTPGNAEAGTLETLPNTEGLIILTHDDIILNKIRFSEKDKVCITSEASIDLIKNCIDDDNRVVAINLLKDKFKFRGLLKQMYPNYEFRNLAFSEIKDLYIDKKSVLKPTKGCFGTAVKIVDQNTDLGAISKEIEFEINKNSSVLSDQVLSKDDFILEDFISGEEYAIDIFYDSKGEPHIVNIYYHPIPQNEAYLHMIYYTSRDVFDKIYNKALQFFKELNLILKVTNFPLHSEFKYDNQNLFPIEINAMRYGGMGLGNMIFHAVGLNPYISFKTETPPEWDKIWRNNEDDIYAFFIAYNGKDINVSQYEPDIEKLENEFTEILNKSIFDYKKQLAFGIFTIRETKANIENLLKIEFNDYFRKLD